MLTEFANIMCLFWVHCIFCFRLSLALLNRGFCKLTRKDWLASPFVSNLLDNLSCSQDNLATLFRPFLFIRDVNWINDFLRVSSASPCHRVHFILNGLLKVSHLKHFDILEFFNVKPVQNWFYSLAMRFQDRDDRPAVICTICKAVTWVCWLSPCLSAAWQVRLMVFRSSSRLKPQLLSVIWWWCWSTNSDSSVDRLHQTELQNSVCLDLW